MGLLAGSKREHLLYLLGIHAQQSLPIDTLSPGQLVPFIGNTSTSQLLWRASSYPQFTLQFPTRVLDTHKVLVHRKSKHKSPRAALWRVLIGSGAVYSFAKSANQLQALYLLYLGFQPLTLLPFLSLIIKKHSLTN